jgi:hypothetical protein
MHRCSKGWNAVAAVAVQWWRIKHLKLLVALLEVWWGSNEILGMPKGGLDMRCSLVFALVHCVLETPLFCSLRAIVYR